MNEKIQPKEMAITVSSFIVGIGILVAPRTIAGNTLSIDGAFCYLIAGMVTLVFAWIIAKLASRFPDQMFYSYTASILSKPVAFVLTFLAGLYYLIMTIYITRSIADMAKHFLFDRTPVYIIVLLFLFVIVYAAFGSEASIIRLHVLFFPIVLVTLLFVLVMNIGFLKVDNLMPVFVTPLPRFLSGTTECLYSLMGADIMLFYLSRMKQPERGVRAGMIGVVIPTLLFMLIYLFLIGVFSRDVIRVLGYPTIELAKEIQVPGEFFERFESVFLSIWIMTIFNTASTSLNLAQLAFSSLFPRMQKSTMLLTLSPLIYLAATSYRNSAELIRTSHHIVILGLFATVLMPFIMLVILKVREVKRRHGQG